MTVTVEARPRIAAIDAVRGFAVLLMVADHLMLVGGVDPLLRLGPTRLAMPLFMVLAGSLVTRLTWRHLGIFVVGLGLPLVVPWVERPSILVMYVIGAVAVVFARRWDFRVRLVLLGVCLAMAANGLNFGSYSVVAVVGLVLLGSIVPRSVWVSLGSLFPSWFAVVGRYPLSVYVGHLLVLRALQVGVGNA